MGPGDVLRVVRERARLTQVELGAILGVSQMWVSYRETGKTKIATEDIDRLSAPLGLTNEDILRLHGREPESAA